MEVRPVEIDVAESGRPAPAAEFRGSVALLSEGDDVAVDGAVVPLAGFIGYHIAEIVEGEMNDAGRIIGDAGSSAAGQTQHDERKSRTPH
jgi:hypothetical protein